MLADIETVVWKTYSKPLALMLTDYTLQLMVNFAVISFLKKAEKMDF